MTYEITALEFVWGTEDVETWTVLVNGRDVGNAFATHGEAQAWIDAQ